MVNRARKIERFLSQPFNVAEQFTGTPGEIVPVDETVESFRSLVDGEHDDIPESAFYMKGSIEQVLTRPRARARTRPPAPTTRPPSRRTRRRRRRRRPRSPRTETAPTKALSSR